MKWAWLVIGAVTLWGVWHPAVTVRDSQGGLVDAFWAQRYKWEQEGVTVHIAGECVSACTIYTGMKMVCVEPRASFLFHQGTTTVATNIMLGSMDPDLRAYVENYGLPLPPYHEVAVKQRDDKEERWAQTFLKLEGDEAVRNGWMKAC